MSRTLGPQGDPAASLKPHLLRNADRKGIHSGLLPVHDLTVYPNFKSLHWHMRLCLPDDINFQRAGCDDLVPRLAPTGGKAQQRTVSGEAPACAIGFDPARVVEGGPDFNVNPPAARDQMQREVKEGIDAGGNRTSEAAVQQPIPPSRRLVLGVLAHHVDRVRHAQSDVDRQLAAQTGMDIPPPAPELVQPEDNCPDNRGDEVSSASQKKPAPQRISG